jgi:hypothetical protein
MLPETLSVDPQNTAKEKQPNIPVPPDQDVPQPVREPPDRPQTEPNAPVREPDPEPPQHLLRLFNPGKAPANMSAPSEANKEFGNDGD